MLSRVRWPLRRWALVAAAVVATGVAFGVVVPRIASYAAVWRVVSSLSPAWLAALLGAVALNVATFAPPWMVVLPGLGLVDALKLTQASTAVTLVVPGGATIGMAASFAMLRSLGFDRPAGGRAVALTGIWSQLSTFLFPAVGAVAVAVEGKGGAPFEIVAVVGGVLFAAGAGLVAAALAYDIGARYACMAASAAVSLARRARRRPPVTFSRADFERFRVETLGLLRSSWRLLSVTTMANQLTAFLLLDLSLRAVGIGIGTLSVADSLTAWATGRLIASLPVTPGGLGLVELGLAGTLIGLGGPSTKVVAAVLIYRLLSIVPTLALGLLAAVAWRTSARHRA